MTETHIDLTTWQQLRGHPEFPPAFVGACGYLVPEAEFVMPENNDMRPLLRRFVEIDARWWPESNIGAFAISAEPTCPKCAELRKHMPPPQLLKGRVWSMREWLRGTGYTVDEVEAA